MLVTLHTCSLHFSALPQHAGYLANLFPALLFPPTACWLPCILVPWTLVPSHSMMATLHTCSLHSCPLPQHDGYLAYLFPARLLIFMLVTLHTKDLVCLPPGSTLWCLLCILIPCTIVTLHTCISTYVCFRLKKFYRDYPLNLLFLFRNDLSPLKTVVHSVILWMLHIDP
jgi:hypothetical protein